MMSAGYVFVDRSAKLFHQVLDWHAGSNTDTDCDAELKKELEYYKIATECERPKERKVDRAEEADDGTVAGKCEKVVRYMEMSKREMSEVESEMER